MTKEYKKINGQHDPSRSQWRIYDYLVKDLPMDFRQSLFHKLSWDDYAFIEQLTEEDKGFSWFRSIGFSDNEIKTIKEHATKYFREVNEMMAKASRAPLYPHPENAVESSKRHLELMKMRSYEEVVGYFGCEFPDYEPLRINDGVISREDDLILYSYDGIRYKFSSKDDDLELRRYREPWIRACIVHNPFSITDLLENKTVTASNGNTYDIDSFCKLLSRAIRNRQYELDLLDPLFNTVEIIGDNYYGQYDRLRTACRGIIIEDSRILLVYETVTGQYMIPGGGLENGETEKECCKREISEETGKLIEPLSCVLEIDEYYENWKYVSMYYLCKVTGDCDRKLTERELEVGMETCWVPIDEAVEIFSGHAQYADSDEMRRGMYLREYTALLEILKERDNDR